MPRIVAAILLTGALVTAQSRADDYAIDVAHSSAVFKIGHLGISWIHGRFNELEGAVVLDKDSNSFTMTIKAASIDTGIKKRDDHLRGPEFFNVKQYPLITFKSTAVKSAESGYAVTGDLTMHGVTKSVILKLSGGKTAEFPKGVQRVGYTAEVVLKRTDFGMEKMVGPIGDDVHVSVSFEGVRK